METKYLEAAPGNKSNSRRIAWYAFIAGLFFAQEVLLMGYFGSEKISLILLSASVVSTFVGIAGPAMAFAFGQKAQENKTTQNETT